MNFKGPFLDIAMITQIHAKANVIGRRLRQLLQLLYVTLSAKRFTDKLHPRLVIFTDHPERHFFAFNNLFAISADFLSLLRKSQLPLVLFISSRDGYEFARSLNLSAHVGLVVYLDPALHHPNKWHGRLTRAITWPIPAYTDLATRSDAEFEIKPYYLYLFLVLVWVVGFSLGGYFPKDDLLRHTIAYQWGYEYSIPYTNVVHSPSFDLYAGFDRLMGILHRALGDNALAVSQLLSITLIFWAMARFLNGMDNNLKLVLLTVTFNLIAGRIVLGRPSLLCSSIMLALIAYDDSVKPTLKVVAAALMGMLYYLFFLYTIPLIIFDRKYIVSFLLSLVFWFWYAGYAYFAEIYQVIHSMSVQNLYIGENKTIFAYLAGMWIFAVPWLLYWRRDTRKTLITGFFLLSNQVRYVETVIPLIMSFFRFTKLRIPAWAALGAIFFMLVTGSITTLDLHRDMAKMIPGGSTVLTEDMKTMYRLVYFNPTIHISPSYCYGWTDPQAQAIIKDLFTGKLDCGRPFLYKYDYLVESSLKGSPPSCLQLLGTDGEKRLWLVDKHVTKKTAGNTFLM
jgi:hypothetical protein